jgi:hypothetical protein
MAAGSSVVGWWRSERSTNVTSAITWRNPHLGHREHGCRDSAAPAPDDSKTSPIRSDKSRIS